MQAADLHPPDIVAELEKNKAAYDAVKDEMEAQHWGRVVLLHDGAVEAIYNDMGDAYDIGCEKFGLGHFSIYRVGQRPVEIGIHGMFLDPDRLNT